MLCITCGSSDDPVQAQVHMKAFHAVGVITLPQQD